jgi:hypothetical protein
MPLRDLKHYLTGLRIYKPELTKHILHVQAVIESKANEKYAPTTDEKINSTNSGQQWGSSILPYMRSLLAKVTPLLPWSKGG